MCYRKLNYYRHNSITKYRSNSFLYGGLMFHTRTFSDIAEGLSFSAITDEKVKLNTQLFIGIYIYINMAPRPVGYI